MSLLKVDQSSTNDQSVIINVADLVGIGKDPTLSTLKYIGYQNHASGAVLRSVADKLEDNISAKDFGANDNGTADDTNALLAAISAASAYSQRGATVFLPAGIYNVSKSIVVPDRVKLQGVGRRQKIIRCTAAGTSVDPIVNLSGAGTELDGVYVLYATAATTSGTCIRSTGAGNKLTNFAVGYGYNAVQVYSGSAQILQNFEIIGCKYTGLQID